jgi:hypothetical protein
MTREPVAEHDSSGPLGPCGLGGPARRLAAARVGVGVGVAQILATRAER